MFLVYVCFLRLCTLLLMPPELPQGRCYVFLEYAFVLAVHFLNYVFRLITNLLVVFDVNNMYFSRMEYNMCSII